MNISNQMLKTLPNSTWVMERKLLTILNETNKEINDRLFDIIQ